MGLHQVKCACGQFAMQEAKVTYGPGFFPPDGHSIDMLREASGYVKWELHRNTFRAYLCKACGNQIGRKLFSIDNLYCTITMSNTGWWRRDLFWTEA